MNNELFLYSKLPQNLRGAAANADNISLHSLCGKFIEYIKFHLRYSFFCFAIGTCVNIRARRTYIPALLHIS